MTTNRQMMKSIFDWFRRRFLGLPAITVPVAKRSGRADKKWYEPDPMMQEMLRSLAMTEEREIACDEVYAVLDEFVEAVQRGENPLIFMPLVRQHLDMCPDCREEYEALLSMLQPTFS